MNQLDGSNIRLNSVQCSVERNSVQLEECTSVESWGTIFSSNFHRSSKKEELVRLNFVESVRSISSINERPFARQNCRNQWARDNACIVFVFRRDCIFIPDFSLNFLYFCQISYLFLFNPVVLITPLIADALTTSIQPPIPRNVSLQI